MLRKRGGDAGLGPEIVRRLALGERTADIARIVGCTESAVSYHRRQMKPSTPEDTARPVVIRRRGRPQRFDSDRIRAMLDSGMTYQSVASIMGCSAATVSEYRGRRRKKPHCGPADIATFRRLAEGGNTDAEIASCTGYAAQTISKHVRGIDRRSMIASRKAVKVAESRKQAVLRMKAEGATLSEIAKALGCVKNTVLYHLGQNGNDSIRTRSKAAKQGNQQRILEYLLARSCVDCGETDPVVMEFDHRDPSQKDRKVARGLKSYRWELVLAEIEKCDVVCCNCHRRRTARQFGSYRLDYVLQQQPSVIP